MPNPDKTLFPAIKSNSDLNVRSNEKPDEAIRLRHRFIQNKRHNGVRSVNVSTDNRYLIITFESDEGRICVLDLKKLEYLPNNYNGHNDSVRLTSITKDNKSFFTASWDGTSRHFDITSGECTQIIGGFGRSPSCCLSANEKLLFTASYEMDNDINSKNWGRCWDAISGDSINVYKHTKERKRIEAIDIAYDENNVYTGSDDGITYKWNIKGKKPVLQYFSCEGSIRRIAISANYFAAACTDGYVRVHNKFSGKYFKYFFHGDADVLDVRISKDEKKLWSAAADGTVKCYDLMTGKLIFHRKPHSRWIWSICLMSNEKILVTGSGDSTVAFLSADSGKILARLKNLLCDRDILISCPPDKTFPNGFFYTSNKNYIEVIINENKKRVWKKLKLNDPRRDSYINKLNLKNLVITRLKGNEQYNSLTRNYVQNLKLLGNMANNDSPRLLNS